MPKTSKHRPANSINFNVKSTINDYADADYFSKPAASPNRTAKSHLNSPASTFRARRTSQISKKIAERKGTGGHQTVNLSSPTSLQMKNRFIIKSANASFDIYYQNMRRRKAYQSVTTSNLQSPSPKSSQIGGEQKEVPKDPNYGFLAGQRPTARDGHTALMIGEHFYVFGGDRHQMPFNDSFRLNLK